MIARAAILAAAVALLAAPATAAAQMAGAQGKPLRDGSLPAGTATVRVVEGAIEQPLSGLEVTLQGDDGSTYRARTDAQGRASFQNLETGVSYVASTRAKDEELETQSFQMPEEGGLRFLLSPVPMGGGGGGGPPMASGAGSGGGQSGIPPIMQNPRRISGQARPEGKDPAGKLTIRTIQGKFQKTAAGLVADVPEGTTIHLIGYTPGGEVTYETREVDEEGRVSFDGLATSGVSYYALALYEREGGQDRLISKPVQLPPRVGMRMMLAGLDPGSGEPPADDLPGVSQQGQGAPQPGPGVVSVRLFGSQARGEELQSIEQLELFEAGSDEPITKAPVGRWQPEPKDIRARASELPQDLPNLPEGAVGFLVFRMSARQGLPGVEVEVTPAGGEQEEAAADESEGGAESEPEEGEDAEGEDAGEESAGTRRTNERGVAVFADLEPGREYVARATVHGKVIATEPFTAPEQGTLSMGYLVDWPAGALEARFTGVPGGEDKVYYARARTSRGRRLHTVPFQLTESRGAAVDLLVYPELLFGFHGGVFVEDNKLWFELRVLLANPSEVPYEPEDGAISIPLPKGFVGFSVNQETRVEEDPNTGLVWRGALPPGQHSFEVSFALPIEGGKAKVDWALPHGVRLGNLMLQRYPGMRVVGMPENFQPKERKMQDGRSFLVFERLSIPQGKRLVFSIHNLPEPPAWSRWLKLGVGLAVLALIVWAVVGVLERQRRAARIDPVRRGLLRKKERLFDELVRIETAKRKGKMSEAEHKKSSERLRRQLKDILEQLGEAKEPERRRAAKR